MLDRDPFFWEEVDEWLGAAIVTYQLEHDTLELLGHYYSGMLDIYSDLTLHRAVFGGHVELLEVDELAAIRREVGIDTASERISLFKTSFDIQAGCDPEDLMDVARTSIALDCLVERHELDSLAYYYNGTGNADNLQTMSSIILGTSLPTARGIPVAGEYAIKERHCHENPGGP